MKFRYVTIEREYGSGGSKIARRLSRGSQACPATDRKFLRQ